MIFNIPGLVLDLRKPEISDIQTISSWIALPEFINQVGGLAFDTSAGYITRSEQILQENADEHCTNKYFLACDKVHGVPVGLVMICKIDWKNRHAEYAYIIGNQRYRGSLFTGDMNVIVYNYLFFGINLNKVYGFVFDENHAAMRINHFGGKLEGTLRRHRRYGTSTRDVHVFSITRAEFCIFIKHHASGVLRKHIARNLIQCP